MSARLAVHCLYTGSMFTFLISLTWSEPALNLCRDHLGVSAQVQGRFGPGALIKKVNVEPVLWTVWCYLPPKMSRPGRTSQVLERLQVA